jgi:hypothetical protein
VAKIISVIVPTMWKANEFFLKMLPILEYSRAIGEVIIIDNNPAECPKEELAKYNKILYKAMPTNQYFNMSMNIGAALAQNEVLCLLNDDVIFDPEIFSFIAKNMDDKVGMISPHPQYFNRGQENAELIKELKLLPLEKTLDGFGCAMFCLRKNYATIPYKLKHHFGDEFLHKTQEKNGRTNMTLHNWVVMTPMRVTTKAVPSVQQVIEQDWAIATEVFAQYGLENPIR